MTNQTDPSRYELLVSRLIDRTSDGRLEWDTTARQATFISVLNKGSVEISRQQHFDDEADHPTEWFELVILDQEGRVAERLSSEPGFSGDDSVRFPSAPLSKLFRLARDSAVDTSQLVDDLIIELG